MLHLDDECKVLWRYTLYFCLCLSCLLIKIHFFLIKNIKNIWNAISIQKLTERSSSSHLLFTCYKWENRSSEKWRECPGLTGLWLPVQHSLGCLMLPVLCFCHICKYRHSLGLNFINQIFIILLVYYVKDSTFYYKRNDQLTKYRLFHIDFRSFIL